MLSWLKKYGLVILKDALIVLGIGSSLATATQTAAGTKASDTLTNIATIVTDVESAAASMEAAGGTLTGPQKLAAASGLVNQVMQDWFKQNMPGTPKVANQASWESGITGIVNGVVAILNSVEPKVATVGGVAAAPAVPKA